MARKIEVQLVGDSRSLERAFGRAHGSGSKLSAGLKTLGKVGLAAVGASAVGMGIAFKRGFDEVQEAQKVAAQTRAVLKSTGGVANVTAKDVDSLAQSLSHMSGVDDELIASGENLLLTFRNIRNETGKGNDIFNQATESVLDLSVALGKDMQSSAIMVGKALNDPIAGLTALGRAGVQFTKKQKEQIKALVESGKTMEAQKLILAELEAQIGGSAEAAGDTLPGALDKLRNAFDETAGKIVSSFAPALADVAERFSKFIERFSRAKGFEAKLRIVWLGVSVAVKDLFDRLRDEMLGSREALRLPSGKILEWKETQGLVDKLRDALETVNWQQVGETIGRNISTKVRITAEFIGNVLKTAHEFVDSHLSEFAELGAKMVLAVTLKLTDPKFWVENWRLVGVVAISAFPVGRFAALSGRVAAAMARPIVRLLPEAFSTAARLAQTALGVLFRYIAGPFQALLGRIPGWLRAAFKVSIVVSAVEAIKAALESVRGAVQRVVNFVQRQWGRLPGILQQAVVGFNPVISTASRLWGWLQSIINAIDTLAGKIRSLPSIPNPGGSLLDIIGRQHGGPVTAGRPYMVGERGPELFVPRSAGTVVPNGQPAMTGGGGRFLVLTDAEGVAFLQQLNGRYTRSSGGRSIW